MPPLDSLPSSLKRFFEKVPPRRLLLGIIDALLIAFSLILAYLLRFDFSIPAAADSHYALQLKTVLPWVIVGQIVIFALLGHYRGMLRYASVNELLSIVAACSIGVFVLCLLNIFIQHFTQLGSLPVMGYGDKQHVMRIPWSVPVIFWLAMIVSVGGFRFSRRLWTATGQRFERGATRILVAGAGDFGESMVRSMLADPASGLRPVALATRHPRKIGMRLHGLPVACQLKDISQVLAREEIGEVVVAMENVTPEELRTIVSQCERASVKVNIAPSLSDVRSGRVSVSALRPVQIEDLLAREAVRLEIPPDRNYLKGECVLITGAGGSIGSELCRQVLTYGPKTLILLGKGENSIYEIHDELRSKAPLTKLALVIGDVRDLDKMSRVFEQYQPTIVFHAAAHKHVPLMEFSPDEAVKNNVVGTAVVARLAHLHGVRKFILVSTDKAVRPTSVMGATKRVAEQTVFSLGKESKTDFRAVRFGNVLGSRGSVIPLFKRQIERGGPVTVTHPDVTRFFMTVPEAVSLILQAGAMGKEGRLFVLDMGQPIRIVDLARNLIVLSGLKPDADIKIEFIGLRPGEKLKEDLLTEGEGITRTELGKVFTAEPDPTPSWKETMERVDALADAAGKGDPPAIRSLLAGFVPDYHPEGTAPKTPKVAAKPVQDPTAESARTIPEGKPAESAQMEKDSGPETGVAVEEAEAEREEEAEAESAPDAEEAEEVEVEEEQRTRKVETPELFAETPEEEEPPPAESAEGPAGAMREEPSESEKKQVAEKEARRENGPPAEPAIPPAVPEAAPEKAPEARPTQTVVETPPPPKPASPPRPKAEPASLWDLDDDEEPTSPPAVSPHNGETAPAGESQKTALKEVTESSAAAREDEAAAARHENAPQTPAPPPTEEPGSPDQAPEETQKPEGPASTESTSSHRLSSAVFPTPPPPSRRAFDASRDPSVSLETRPPDFLILYPVYTLDQPIEGVVKAFLGQHPGNFALEIIDCTADGLPLGSTQAAMGNDPRVRLDRGDFFNPAQMINRGIATHRDARYLIPLPPWVTPLPDCLVELEQAFRRDEDVACVFADFNLLTVQGRMQRVELLDWTPGIVHERHEFGYLQAYRVQALRDLEGMRDDLRFAADYDLMLRLTDDWTYHRVSKPLAVVAEADLILPEEPDLPDSTRLRYPGEPPFGGFSYLFYPPEMEEEVASVFEQMLHRRGFWVEPTPQPIPAIPTLATDMDVSVVIPVQNGERLIANSIQKTLHGTLQSLEILVADAGSGDRTREVVQKFMARDRRVRYIVDESGSRLGAINQALRQARGRYIAHLEWDDELAPSALEQMVAYLKNHPKCAMAVSHYEIIDEEGNPVRDIPSVTHENYTPNQLLRHDGIGAVRLVPRGVLKHFNYYQARNYSEGGEDYDLALKVSEQFEIGRVPEVLYRRRQWEGRRPSSIAREKNLDYARLEAIRRRREMNRTRGRGERQ